MPFVGMPSSPRNGLPGDGGMSRKLAFIAFLAGVFFFAPPQAKADYVFDYYAASTWASTTGISADGIIDGGFGSYIVDAWRPGFAPPPIRCAEGSSFTPGSDIDFYLDQTFNNCSTLLNAVGSTTIKVVVAGGGAFQVFEGIWNGDVWRTAINDDSTVTGVITPIVSPSMPPSATSSPLFIKFNYTIATTSDSKYTQYQLLFKQSDTNETFRVIGSLPDVSVGTHTVSTTTPVVGTEGTWGLTIALTGTITDPDDLAYGVRFYATRASHTFFGLGSITNTDVFSPYVPPAQSDYSAASCAINFLGTFDLLDCLGYLIVPGSSLYASYGSLKDNLMTRFPFAFIGQVPEIRNELFESPQTASSTVSVDIPWFNDTSKPMVFLSAAMIEAVPFAATMRTILGWLLWIMLAEAVYIRVIKSHDKDTHV